MASLRVCVKENHGETYYYLLRHPFHNLVFIHFLPWFRTIYAIGIWPALSSGYLHIVKLGTE
jgi:hypothetical protein